MIRRDRIPGTSPTGPTAARRSMVPRRRRSARVRVFLDAFTDIIDRWPVGASVGLFLVVAASAAGAFFFTSPRHARIEAQPSASQNNGDRAATEGESDPLSGGVLSQIGRMADDEDPNNTPNEDFAPSPTPPAYGNGTESTETLTIVEETDDLLESWPPTTTSAAIQSTETTAQPTTTAAPTTTAVVTTAPPTTPKPTTTAPPTTQAPTTAAPTSAKPPTTPAPTTTQNSTTTASTTPPESTAAPTTTEITETTGGPPSSDQGPPPSEASSSVDRATGGSTADSTTG